MVNAHDKSRLIQTFNLALVVVFVIIFLPVVIGFAGGGFDSEYFLNLFQSYGVFGLGGLIAILLVEGKFYLSHDDDAYKASTAFDNTVDSIIPLPNFLRDRVALTLLSFIVFSILDIFIGLKGQSFTGEVLAAQQFTPVGEIFYKFFQIPAAENVFAAGCVAIFIGLLVWLAKRNSWSQGTYTAISFVGIIGVTGTVGVLNHLLRYGNSELAIVNVAFFWLLGGLLTALTGSFIPFVVMHMCNNLIFDLQKHFSSDAVTITIIILLSAIAGFTFYYLQRRKMERGR